jgi:hypothetical protein
MSITFAETAIAALESPKPGFKSIPSWQAASDSLEVSAALRSHLVRQLTDKLAVTKT